MARLHQIKPAAAPVDYGSLPPDLLDRVTIAYICSPANPQGAVASRDYWADLLALAEKHDFLIFADECYSEIWRTAPPPGALEVAQATGADPERLNARGGLDLFAKAYPERFFSLGIAEQNCVGVAAGLALNGKIPV